MGISGKKSKKKGARRGGKSIVPEDWIIYYLRKKALTHKIEISELARIIYVLNQRRGFKSSRKDLQESTILPYSEFKRIKDKITNSEYRNKEFRTQFVSITKVSSVTQITEERDKKGNFKYLIKVADERIADFEISRKKSPEWVGNEYTFLVEQKIRNGKFEQLQPKTPTPNDWGLCTTALDEKINNFRTPGEYFFEQIKEAYLAKRNYKARQYPVYRWRYQKELKAIWEKQCELNPELDKLNKDTDTLTKLAQLLYPTQAKYSMPKLAEFKSRDLLHIISNDIIYYQRELKSQKNFISECRYEKRKGIDGEIYGLKCIPRSSPLFQEFRIWQDIHNIRILKKEEKSDGKIKIDIDVSSRYISENVKEKLFDLFNSKLSISEADILKAIQEAHEKNDITINKSDEKNSHRINLFSNRDSLKGNEVLVRYRSLFKKAGFDDESVLCDKKKLMRLWHIDYSITSSDEQKSKKGITTALTKLLPDNPNKSTLIDLFAKLPEFKKEYGSFSSCAIKKMLPLMRSGKYWNEADVPDSVKLRAQQIQERLESVNHNIRRLTEISDDDVQKQVLKSFIGKNNLTKGLNTYQAAYLIYDKHSEREITPLTSVEDFSRYIQKEVSNNSLRNPIVEQVVRETMFLVRDIWKEYGEINEIHIELGRELKKNSEEKFKISERQKVNTEENQRIRKLLYELMNGFEEYDDEGNINQVNFSVKPNPESPRDIDKFKIWKENSLVNKNVITQKKNGDKTVNIILNKDVEFEALYKDGKKERIPTKTEIKKYTLWLSQNCRSPYTGKIIPLSKLFDKHEYEIEHIIPQSKYANDGYNNLVIAEAALNPKPYKGDSLARNFIAKFGGKDGKEYEINGRKYSVLAEDQYESYCKDAFKHQKAKLKNLLATEVPEDFVDRQLNDTRYIGRKLSELLAPVVKDQNGIIFTGGGITSELKRNWGLNSVWKEIIRPRFERLEKITGNQYIIHEKDELGNPIIHFNVRENEQLDLKRIDHRHHALDALIIAATTREHIRYLNTLSAADTDEEIKHYKGTLVKGKIRDFKHPWEGFTKEAKDELEKTIVTFKINNKIVSQPKNRIIAWKFENGKPKGKFFKEQKPHKKWMAVRRSMFKEPLGTIWIKEIQNVSVKDAFLTEIERQLIDSNKEKRKTASYIYDKHARQVIKGIIQRCNSSIDEKEALVKEIEGYLKKNCRKVDSGKISGKGKAQSQTEYLLDGVRYKRINVARFLLYKTKRMALTNKDYVEKLTIEKMKNDFPNFSFVSKEYFDTLTNDKKEIILKANLPISENKKLSAFNLLMLEHILEYNNNPKEAFNSEGVEKLNKKALQNPKIGKEIKSVTRLDGTVDLEDMFNGGIYETDKGAMAYFVMYENQKTRKREVLEPSPSIPTHKAIERIVRGEPIAEDREGFNKIILSPGDLVYVPSKEDLGKIKQTDQIESVINWNDKKKILSRIYKVAKFTGKQCYFLKSTISDLIIPYDGVTKLGEYGSQNYSERSDDDLKIIDVCMKLKVDRLGNIIAFGNSAPYVET